MKPCRTCGASDRYADGKCKPCQRRRVAERRKARVEEGQCRDCEQYAMSDSTRCWDCNVKHRRRMRDRRKGLAPVEDEPIEELGVELDDTMTSDLYEKSWLW